MIPTYNYGYPMNYPTNLYPKQPEMNNGILWVQGIEGAKAYQMTPNSNVQLMDSENDGVFYIKITDNIGMATLRVFHYTEVAQQDTRKNPVSEDLSEYVKKSELSDLIKSILAESEVADEQPLSANAPTDKSKPIIKG